MADNLAQAPLHACLSKCTNAAGTTTTLSTTGTNTVVINGKIFTFAALANVQPTAGDAVTGAAALTQLAINTGTVYLLLVDSTGAAHKVAQGTVEALDGAAVATAKFIRAPQFPGGVPQNLVPIGYVIARVGSNGSAWALGLQNSSGVAGVTLTFVDIATLPDRPQVS